MKKVIIIIILIIIILAISRLLWWYDDTRIMEEPIDIVKTGQKAFSVKDNVDNVVLTIYDSEIPRTVTTFYFKADVVNNVTFERVYINKAWAKGGMNEDYSAFYDRKLNTNTVSGKIDLSIGEAYDGFAQKLIDTYSKSLIIIK